MVSRTFLISAAVAAAVPASPASADDADADADGDVPAWRYDVDVVNRVVALGYEPVWIIEEDADEPFVAADRTRRRIEVRGRISAESRHLRIDLEPYTVVPEGGFSVNAAGVELNALYPVEGFGYVGYYHHSAHNFNFGGFGRGINLNAVVIDARRHQRFALLDDEADLRLRFLFHGYPIGDGPAHVITERTAVAPEDVGVTKWRSDLDAVLRHDRVRAECGLVFASGHVAPSSARLGCAGLYAVGDLLGEVGKRLFIGPYANGALNFFRAEAYGRGAWSLGLRVDLVLAENAFLR